MTRPSRGSLAALAAFVIWGLFPLYWKQLAHVPAPEVMAHRLVWSFAVVLLWLLLARQWTALRELTPRTWLALAVSGALITANWGVYIWAVAADRVVDASLGYFINPLMSVLLGTLMLGERLRRLQWVAVAIAAAGVVWLSSRAGGVPWVAFLLALSFGLYGLIRKQVAVSPGVGLSVEGGLWLLPALVWLAWRPPAADGDPVTWLWLAGGGLATALPLALFAYGTRRIRLVSIGFMQYITPSMQLLIGVLVYRESFGIERAIGFGLIWVALALYMADAMRAMRDRRLAR